MELSWLEDFLALVDSRNFSRAAEQRNCTQPAFSRRIKALEDWAGAPLFNRDSQPIALTPAGEQFRPAVDEILRRLYLGRDQVRRTHAATAETLRFAATHSLSQTFFPNWVRSVEEMGRAGTIRLDSDTMQACERLLIQGQCQFLLCHSDPGSPSPFDPRQFISAKVGAERLLPVTGYDENGKPAALLPGTAERPLPYLAYSEESGIGRAVEVMLAAAGPVWLDRCFVSHLAAVLRRMVLGGRGLAWLPESLIRQDLADGLLVSAGEGWGVTLDIRLIRPRSRLVPAAEEFWRLVA